MRLLAGMPASPSTRPGEHPGLGHLTPMESGWLLGLVFEVDDRRLVASHLVKSTEAGSSGPELAARIRALGKHIEATYPPASVMARHILDATAALETFDSHTVGRAARELSKMQLQVAFGLLEGALDKTVYVSDVAAACNVSEGHFRRAFRTCTGVSPQQWRQERRMRYCRRRLAESDEPLAHIAEQAGFAAQSHFSRVFTQLTGMSPSEWRRIVRPAARVGSLGLPA